MQSQIEITSASIFLDELSFFSVLKNKIGLYASHYSTRKTIWKVIIATYLLMALAAGMTHIDMGPLRFSSIRITFLNDWYICFLI